MNIIKDEKGRVIGRELDNGQLLDGKGRLVARLVNGGQMTVNEHGENKGRGDQRMRLLKPYEDQ